jgi:hypothetical protein
MVSATRQAQSVEYRLGDGRLIQALDLLRGVLRNHISHRADLIDQLDLPEETQA